MPEIVLNSLAGGVNNSDPPTEIADDQCVVGENVEFHRSNMGERRLGSVAINLIGSDLETCNRVVWMHRHLPTSDPSDAQLWAMGIVGSGTAVLCYKDTAWHTVLMADAPIVDGTSEYQIRGITLHGKLFIAYKSAVDRLHVWDGTSFRRVGLLAPLTAPSPAESGTGTLTAQRHYRWREIVMDGTTVVLRSEPSGEIDLDLTGTAAQVVVSRGTAANSNSTHWELEGSFNDADWYVIATPAIGTPSATDDTDVGTGYAKMGFELSEDIGDYEVPGSARVLLADEDRLLLFGSFEDDALDSAMQWTPVYNDPGVGNDERIPLDPVSLLNLDGFEGGAITDAGRWSYGEIAVFKDAHTYKVIRTGTRQRAYSALAVSKTIGALSGSVTEAVDEAGNAALFFDDAAVGAYRYTVKNGMQYAGADVWTTWQTVNLDATVAARSLYYPTNRQVWSCVATADADTPDLGLKIQTNAMRTTDGGDVRRGYAMVTGPQAGALTMCLFADNIDDNTARSRTLVPFIGVEGSGLIWRCDTGDDDNGTEYVARLTSKPLAPARLETQCEVRSGTLVAKATDDARVVVSVIRDGGISPSNTSDTVDLSPAGDETFVIRPLDLGLAELHTVQFDISDTETPGARWELARLAVTVTLGQGS